ncbi:MULTISPECIES: Mrp/NBP35 family ATP-binding protein [unclassified Rathayibacter]|uniref:Mrp/NBP35 family ATP-binding protein n=1 Tax=unclassified Rathayibacter TaxID=2609250 RepID=UPI00104A7760|nr:MULTISPECIES: Mrp/NBP35 family ATP-binding protein [unclassified Rathayibacter]TCL84441.1 ATP-binding protein involved in chromosome partitioning [Rathayibacter sp. PhB192]TCM30159.1 ATP-binding protein involved in chromosome partitioning [Rathayibacter sp. PhB179]
MPDVAVTGPADPAALESAVLAALARVIDPEIRKPITELDMVDAVTVGEDGAVTVAIRLTIVGCPAASAIERDVRAAAESAAGSAAVRVEVGVMTPAQRTALTERLRGGRREMPFGPDSLTRVYAVTSGKGGVGKSTVTANLAVALARRGLAVGLVDADVHGFSIPGLLGLMHDGRVDGPTRVGELMLPPVAHGVKVISIGMFLEGDTRGAAVSWRGPMLHRTISQFLTDVYFGDLDVLLLDLPPGTGDVAISIGQLLPHAEVLIVTTPQPAAADVAERSGALARQSGQRIVGVVENMSGLPQPDGSVLELFGSGGGAEVARRLSASGEDVPLLASLPISVALRAGGDDGLPVVIGDPEDPAAVAITELARTLASRPRGLTGRRLPMSVG